MVHHTIEACHLFYIPTILCDGWALYICDMLTSVIQVYDPSSGPNGCNQDQLARHELIASRLRDAFVRVPKRLTCLVANTQELLVHLFPPFHGYLNGSITRDETGMCVMHITRYHDGEKLRMPITRYHLFAHKYSWKSTFLTMSINTFCQINLAKTRKPILQDMMKFQGVLLCQLMQYGQFKLLAMVLKTSSECKSFYV